MPGVVLRCLVVVLLVAPLVFRAPHVLSCGPGCSVCSWAAAFLHYVAWGPTGVPGAVGPGRPRDRHTRA